VRAKPEKKIQSAGGIGDSRIFGGAEVPNGIGDTRKFLDDGTPDLSGYTVNGESLPQECWSSFPISLTDQGKADMERERKNLPVMYKGRSGRPGDYSDVPDDDRKIEKYRDDLMEADFLQTPASAMQQVMDKNIPVGHRGLWIGNAKAEREGLIRGQLEYKPVLVKNPETGLMERVKMGSMFLASVPENLALRQEQINVAMAQAREVSVNDKVIEQSEKIIGSSQLQELARRRRTLEDLGGAQADDPEVADRELMAHEV
jgi:hypothetical protein